MQQKITIKSNIHQEKSEHQRQGQSYKQEIEITQSQQLEQDINFTQKMNGQKIISEINLSKL